MNLRTLFTAATSVALAFPSYAAFEWSPVVTQPSPTADVTQAYQIERLSFNCNNVEGVAMTDLLPIWVDEDGKEIAAESGVHDPWGWDASQFEYYFNFSEFSSNGEYILLFPEGMLVDANGEPSAKKEIPYTFDVPELAAAMFDDFKVISISPDLEQPQAIWDQQVITISTNHNDAIGLVMLTVKDVTSGEVIMVTSNFATGRTTGDASDIVWTMGGVHKFFEGHTYQAEIIFYNGKDSHGSMGEITPIVDRVIYEFTGRVESYRYSSIELISVSPDPEPESVLISQPNQAVFKYVFSGPVNVYMAETPLGQNGSNVYPLSCLSSNPEKTEWTLDLSESNFVKNQDSMLTINIYVRDLDGAQLEGNRGEETQSCFQYSWQCELGATPIELVNPAAGETLKTLSSIVVKAVSGRSMSWSWTGTACVRTVDGEIVGTLVYELPENAHSSAFKEIKFSSWINANGTEEDIYLTQEGKYEAVFDHGCFVFGEQYDSTISHSLVSAFELSGFTAVDMMETTEDRNVFDMQGRLLLRNASEADIRSLDKGMYVIGGKKVVVK